MIPNRHTLIAGAILILAGCSGSTSVPSQVGDMAPRFKLRQVSTGDTFDSERLKGDVVLLNFWTTSCLVCAQEIDELKKIQSEGQVKVVGIALDADVEQVDKVVKARGINYPVLLGDEEIFTKYDGYNIPYTLVLDPQLSIRKKIYGRIDMEEFNKLVATIKRGT